MPNAGEEIRRHAARTQRSVVYCLIPAALAPKLHETLREHFGDDPGVRVVVERRGRERRSGAEQRERDEQPPGGGERRALSGLAGRRVGERRAAQVPIESLPLPRRARRYAEQLSFVRCPLPSGEAEENAESTRLALRAKAGDRDAFADLYLRYFDPVFTYFRAALKDVHEAEDRTQEVFTKLLGALPGYEARPGVPFRAWLFRVARNEAISYLRKQSHVELEPPEEIERRRERDEPQVELEAELGWLSDSDLLFLVDRLPPLQRQALTLRYLLGLTNKEIAAIMERSPEAVGQLHVRARQFLAERLEAIGERREGKQGQSTQRTPMIIRLRKMPVLGARRQSLGGPPGGR